MPETFPMRHIMILVDGTEASFLAADAAIVLAGRIGARLTALAVLETETLHNLLSVRILIAPEMEEFERELQDSARRHLAEIKARAAKSGLLMEEAIATGNSETIIPAEVRARAVDLIVMGAFYSGHAVRDLLARQRQQVIDHAPCSVLVVKDGRPIRAW